MKNLVILIFLFLCGCSEAVLERSTPPTLLLTEEPDVTIPFVKQMKEDYGINVIYHFHDTMDFRFTMADKNLIGNWNNIHFKKFNEKEDALFGIDYLEKYIFCYFKKELYFNNEVLNNEILTTIIPRHIFVVDSLYGMHSSVGQYLVELNESESEEYFSFIWNGFEPMFAFNAKILEGKTEKEMLKFRNSALYAFISHLLIDKELYKELPVDFFEVVSYLYGTNIKDKATEDNAPTIDRYNSQGVSMGPYWYAGSWYTSLGLAITNHSPEANTGVYSRETAYDQILLINKKTLNFPTKIKDLRNMLHVVICEDNIENLYKYYINDNPIFINRMKILIRQMYHWGIDVYAINPSMREFYKYNQ